jgi:hypothetical protein
MGMEKTVRPLLPAAHSSLFVRRLPSTAGSTPRMQVA